MIFKNQRTGCFAVSRTGAMLRLIVTIQNTLKHKINELDVAVAYISINKSVLVFVYLSTKQE